MKTSKERGQAIPETIRSSREKDRVGRATGWGRTRPSSESERGRFEEDWS